MTSPVADAPPDRDGPGSAPPDSFRERARAWRRTRPVAGAVLLMLSGGLIAFVPLQFATELLLVGGSYTFIGLLFAVLVFLSGVVALRRPAFAPEAGLVGAAMAILSIFGALGGLFVGLLVGVVGGNLCLAWRHESAPTRAGERHSGTADGEDTGPRRGT